MNTKNTPEMKSIEWIRYNHGYWEEKEPKLLNELSISELKELSDYAGVKYADKEDEQKTLKLVELLINKFGEKTFCSQVDFDFMFGNITWMRPYWCFADAEQVIKQQSYEQCGTPSYCLDDSDIFIYRFDELHKADNKRKENIGYYLREQLQEKIL